MHLRDSAIFGGVPEARPLYDIGQLKKKRKYKPRVRKHPVPFLSRLVQMFEVGAPPFTPHALSARARPPLAGRTGVH